MKRKCHFIGIGGIGMSGLAQIMLDRECSVSGSDLSLNYVTEGLQKKGAKVFIGHSPANIASDSTVVYSTDIKGDNPEYQAALQLNCEIFHRSDFLALLMQEKKALAIAGTHGKTTTSALLAAVLLEGQYQPSFAIGGILPQLKTNAGAGEGDFFVAEADESDGTFLKYNPYGSIVTNIDLDHMSHFGSEENLITAFSQFMQKTSQHLFWCGDDPRLQKLQPKGTSYGFSVHNQLKINRYRQEGWKLFFDLDFDGKLYQEIELGLVGKHNVLNAAAVFGLALAVHVPEKAIRNAFKTFGGVLRRCEKKGSVQDVLLLDDYAHHPTEILTTLNGVRRAVMERRLIAVYQPHRYTRTRDCLGTFAGAFESADEVIITDIFTAGEEPILGVTPEHVLEEVQKTSKAICRYISKAQLVDYLAERVRPHDVVISLGAGNITKLGSELLEKFKLKPPRKIKIGVIFGGQSSEHEVSIRSAQYVATSLNPEYYQISYLGITKQGEWIKGDLDQIEMVSKGDYEPISHQIFKEILSCDVLFPVLHGPFGEDGTVQGFFEMIGKPYVGCDHTSSAIVMDKDLTKQLMQNNHIPTLPYMAFSLYEWRERKEEVLQSVSMKYPLFVKPVHLGSSIGIKKVQNREELIQAIEYAFGFDVKVLIEEGVDAREIEFSVLGNGRVRVFPPGEICAMGGVYDYASKYGSQAAITKVRAELHPQLVEEGMALAKAAYQAAGCMGMSRVDFFLDKNNQFWLNEINPIPGFTKISLYPKMCEANGLSGQELVSQLIILALERKRQKRCIECIA